jgi:hypothetical protein
MITLNKREKLLLKVLLSCLGIFVLYYLIIAPVIKLVSGSGDDENKPREDLARLEKIYKQYRDVQQKKSSYTQILNKKNDNTTSLIEQWASTAGISKNVAYTRSSQSSLQNKYIRITSDVRIEGVAIQQFMKFLYDVENSDNLIKISYLKINPALKGTNTYDVNLKIDNFIAK